MPSRKPLSKQPTRVIRIHEDVASLAEDLAKIFDESLADFASRVLRAGMEGLIPEASEVLDRKKQMLRDHGPKSRKS